MSKYTFEQYRSLFNATVEKNKDAPFYAALSANFGIPQFPAAAPSVAVLGIRHTGEHIVDDRDNTADDIIRFAWGGNEGTHNTASMNTSLFGGSARPSLY